MMNKEAIAFEYRSNVRQQAYNAGLKESFALSGFVQRYIRPMFCESRGPVPPGFSRWKPDDIYALDNVILREFAHDKELCRWIRKAREHIKFQGLPARVCWLEFGERAHFGKIIDDMVADGTPSGPV